jgi:hypothetical protein
MDPALASMTLSYKFIICAPRPLDACVEQRPGLRLELVLCNCFVSYD